MHKTYGYARVSSKDQNADRQLIALKFFGTDIIFVDRQSGKNFDRPQYKKLLRKLKPNDVLVVKSIDRLGRNYVEILDNGALLPRTRERLSSFLILLFSILVNVKIIGTLIAGLVIQIMSAFAQIERDFIRQRQAEGIVAAIACGIHFGRSPKERLTLFPTLRDQ